MYTNKIGCTVYERTVGADRMEAYVRHFIPAIYWEQSVGQAKSGNGMTKQDSVLCIIPASSLTDYIPKHSDLIVCGKCEGDAPPEHGVYTVMQVEDFRYGSPEVQHLEVTAT